MTTPTLSTAAPTVFDQVAALVAQILDTYGMDPTPIDPTSSFQEDLEMESIDLVTLAGLLAEHFGDEVNLAEFLASMDLEEVIDLTVGDVAAYVATQVDPAASPLPAASEVPDGRI